MNALLIPIAYLALFFQTESPNVVNTVPSPVVTVRSMAPTHYVVDFTCGRGWNVDASSLTPSPITRDEAVAKAARVTCRPETVEESRVRAEKENRLQQDIAKAMLKGGTVSVPEPPVYQVRFAQTYTSDGKVQNTDVTKWRN